MAFSSPKCTSFVYDDVTVTGFKRCLKYSPHIPVMPPSLRRSVTHSVGRLCIRQYSIFSGGGAGWFVRTLSLLASDLNPVYILNSPMIEFWMLPPWVQQTFALSAYSECKEESAFLWWQAVWATFLVRIASFNSRSYHGVTILPLFVTSSRFLPHNQASDGTRLQLLWRASIPSPHPLCISGIFGTRTINCLQRSFLHLCSSGPHTLFGRISCSCTFVLPPKGGLKGLKTPS